MNANRKTLARSLRTGRHNVRTPRPACEALESRQLMAATAFDSAFGNGGFAKFDVAGLGDFGEVVEPLADGKLLVGGTALFPLPRDADYEGYGQPTEARGVVLRLNADGTPDTTFGDNGRVAEPGGDAAGLQDVRDVAVLPDGKILAAGSTYLGFDGRQGQAFAIARYNADGSRDATFGTNGLAIANFGGGSDYAHALLLLDDGKFVAVGKADPGGIQSDQEDAGDFGDFAVARFNADGSLDTSFNGTGLQTVDFSDVPESGYDEALAAVALPDGGLLVGGAGSNTVAGERVPAFALAKFTAGGQLDATFGGDGTVFTDIADPDPSLHPGYTVHVGDPPTMVPDPNFRHRFSRIHRLLLQPDGKVLAVGSAGSPFNVGVARYAADGSLDTSFAGDGVANDLVDLDSVPSYYTVDGVTTYRSVGNPLKYDAVLQANGSIDVGAIGEDGRSYQGRFAADGSKIESVIATTPDVPGYAGFSAVALHPTGGMFVVGAAARTDQSVGGSEAWNHTKDLLVARVAPIGAQGQAPGTPSAPAEAPAVITMIGKSAVRSGTTYAFKLTFTGADGKPAASDAQGTGYVLVTGPDGSDLTAERSKVKVSRKAAVATFRLRAPGGSFTADDNGRYEVHLPGGGSVTDLQGPIVGQFIVNSKRQDKAVEAARFELVSAESDAGDSDDQLRAIIG